MSSLREAQKQLTRKLLLESGLSVFEAKGYASATIDDIASGAGTTRTTFYFYFPSKAGLMTALIAELNEQLVGADDPRLPEVISSGSRPEIRRWLIRKIDQWPAMQRTVSAAHAAASTDAEVRAAVDQWFEGAIGDIHAGLDRAARFEPATRHVRGRLAFSQLEFLSRRWFDEGWSDLMERDVTIKLLTDSWCALLSSPSPLARRKGR